MSVIAACGALPVPGGFVVLRWGHLAVRPPPAPPADDAPPAIGEAVRLVAWHVTVAAGAVAGFAGTVLDIARRGS